MKINVNEQFPHLQHAPIVEAVIEIRSRAEVAWNEGVVSQWLKPKLSDYPQIASQNEFQQEVRFGLGREPEAKQHDLGWKGLRFQSADGCHIAQFNRDGFLFSRLPLYQNWEQLRDEGMRLWNIHAELARPTEAQRLGLRFINRFVLPVQEMKFEDYIQPHPTPPRDLDLPFLGFFHHETLVVPTSPYAINVARTIQLPQDPRSQGLAIILDIDVFTLQPFELRQDLLVTRLAEMRWLKNKVFFGSVTPKALESFR
jgi:uncharacterized protein (TIGR04255 family)